MYTVHIWTKVALVEILPTVSSSSWLALGALLPPSSTALLELRAFVPLWETPHGLKQVDGGISACLDAEARVVPFTFGVSIWVGGPLRQAFSGVTTMLLDPTTLNALLFPPAAPGPPRPETVVGPTLLFALSADMVLLL